MKLLETKRGGIASTPQSVEMIDVFGGFRHESVVVSHDELNHFRRLAGMGESISLLAKGGDDLNASRLASRDGLRIMALLARHLQLGEDPVKFVAKMMIAFGIDTNVDPAWVEDESEDNAME